MMVVMLILSIVLAAMAPVMTTRNKTDQSSPWKYSEGNLSDAYYGLGESQTAMIGQREFETTDETAKLIINSSSARPSQISFKNNGTNQGLLRVRNNSVLLGSLNDGGSIGTNSVAIGSSVNADENSVSIGKSSSAGDSNSVSVGYLTSATGELSTAVGYNASATGKGSIALGGGGALEQPSAENSGSVAIGYALSTGSNAIAIAPGGIGSSMDSRTRATGSSSIALGGNVQSTKDYSVGIGVSARSTEEYAVAIGTLSSASAKKSIALGYNSNSNGEGSVAIGSEAKADVGSVAIGEKALSSTTGEWNAYNTAVGYRSMHSTTTGVQNTAFGRETLAMNTTGAQNVAVGNYTLPSNTTGTANTVVGPNAMSANQTGSYNSAFGYSALDTNKTGSNNTAIGYKACYGVTGSNKICIGANSGPSSSSSWATDSTERIFIGSKSKFNDGAAVLEVHNGTANHYISKGPRYLSETAVVVNGSLIVKGPIMASIPKLGSNAHEPTGSQLVALFGSDDGSGNIRDAHNSFRGDSNSVENYFNRYGAFKGVNGYVDNLSDRRLKYVGSENRSGLEKIRDLKVFNYTFKKDKKKTPHVGVIAQDLQKIFPDAVTKGKDGFLRIRMEDMFYAVINSIKELDARVTALEKENKDLKQRLEKLEAKLK